MTDTCDRCGDETTQLGNSKRYLCHHCGWWIEYDMPQTTHADHITTTRNAWNRHTNEWWWSSVAVGFMWGGITVQLIGWWI